MKQSLLVLFLLNAVCVLTFANEIQQSEPSQNSTINEYGLLDVNINGQVDKQLNKISTYMVQSGIDPCKLPDIDKKFDVKGLIITHHGKIRLTKGWLQDLRNIERDGNAILNIKLTKWHFKIPIGLNNVEFGYDYRVKLNGLLGRSGGIIGSVKDIQIFIYAVFDIRKRQIELKQFDLIDIGNINVQLTGGPWNDWWLNAFISQVTEMIHDQIVTTVNSTLNVLAQAIVKKINDNMPFHLTNLNLIEG